MSASRHRLLAIALALGLWTAPEAPAQESAPAPAATASVGALVPVKLLISRRTLKNFLTDPEALALYPRPGGAPAELPGVFAIGSAEAGRAILWDPTTCRLLGVLLLPKAGAAPGGEPQYALKASGPLPLAKTSGAGGAPVYFGMRLVNGAPEFLYKLGSLSIEERIWLEDAGSVLKQRFCVSPAPRGLQFTVASDWKERLSASAGTWKDRVLTVPKESAGELVLTYRLVSGETPPANPAP